ncbi:diguanylate cyclase [Pseudomonas sp. Hg3Tf]
MGRLHLRKSGSGIAEGYPHHAQDTDNLSKAADQAMYEAKQRGRNEVMLFSSES